MELNELEKLVIEALAEAKAARILAEKALDRSLAAPNNTYASEPWGTSSEPAIAPTAPFIKVEEVETKPSLAPWYGKKALEKRTNREIDPTVDDVGQDIWDDAMEDSDV